MVLHCFEFRVLVLRICKQFKLKQYVALAPWSFAVLPCAHFTIINTLLFFFFFCFHQVGSSLNSSYCYILHSGSTVFTWCGSLTNTDDQELVERFLDVIKVVVICFNEQNLVG